MLHFSFAPDECDVQSSANDTHIMYDAIIQQRQTGFISRVANTFEVGLQCSFSKRVDVTLNDYFVPLQGHAAIDLEDSTGAFEVVMRLFADAEMTSPINEGHTVQGRDQLSLFFNVA